jgi:hypothetical protein
MSSTSPRRIDVGRKSIWFLTMQLSAEPTALHPADAVCSQSASEYRIESYLLLRLPAFAGTVGGVSHKRSACRTDVLGECEGATCYDRAGGSIATGNATYGKHPALLRDQQEDM